MNWLRSFLQSLGIGKPRTIKADSFGELESLGLIARRNAIGWYRNRYGYMPEIKPVRIIIESKPRAGMAGWTIAISGGYEIHLAREYIDSAIYHEFRHAMPNCMSEESVK